MGGIEEYDEAAGRGIECLEERERRARSDSLTESGH